MSGRPNGPADRFAKPRRLRTVTAAKLRRRTLRAVKGVRQRLALPADVDNRILFIVGCQRSGTDLVTQIFEEDWRAKVYPESSSLSSHDAPRRLRLDPLPEIAARLAKQRARFIVLKPLVESQHAGELLDFFPGSRAIWMYRDFRAVARSRVRKHGRLGRQNQIWDLRAIVDRREGDWCYENVTEELRDTVVGHFSDEMDGYDAAALFWYVRNNLYFTRGLDRDPRVKLCRYEGLLQEPAKVVRELYSFVGQPFPGARIVRAVDPRPLDHGRDLILSPDIKALCLALLRRLDASREAASSPGGSRPGVMEQATGVEA